MTMTLNSAKLGKQSIQLKTNPVINSAATVVGPKEGEGPYGKDFDEVAKDNGLGQKSWDLAESKFLIKALQKALEKENLTSEDIDLFMGGDLLNQTISSNFAARELGLPYYGLYGACSTAAEGLSLASIMVSGKFVDRVLVGTSSHHNGSERQFRYPTEYGGQRPPYAQWTVTGAAGAVLSLAGEGPVIKSLTPGKIRDMNVQDPYDLGSAMAPAAADTLITHLEDHDRSPDDYDLIITGDLGLQGSSLFKDLLNENNIDVETVHLDCGLAVYYSHQDVHGGGSGCACSAVILFSDIWTKLKNKNLNRVLFMATGALHSPVSCQQGESIPGICHAVEITAEQ